MENQKLRVWWRKLDENGNEIERGVDDREYVSYGHACNRARKLFGWGRGLKNKQIEWRVTWRDPWEKYMCEVTCSACGRIFMTEEHVYHVGYPINADSVYVYNRSHNGRKFGRPDYNGYICPDCTMKIHNFISDLRKGE